MLRIRKDQWDILVRAQVREFDDWMYDHVRAQIPTAYEALGEERVRELIRHGRERGGKYGVTGRREVCKYIDLMFVLGKDFDVDLPWAAEILRKPRDPVAKIHFLYREAKKRHNAHQL